MRELLYWLNKCELLKDPPPWIWLFVLAGWFAGSLVGRLVSLLADYWLVSHLVCYLTTLSAAEFIYRR